MDTRTAALGRSLVITDDTPYGIGTQDVVILLLLMLLSLHDHGAGGPGLCNLLDRCSQSGGRLGNSPVSVPVFVRRTSLGTRTAPSPISHQSVLLWIVRQ